jgi:hypothetical protein
LVWGTLDFTYHATEELCDTNCPQLIRGLLKGRKIAGGRRGKEKLSTVPDAQ